MTPGGHTCSSCGRASIEKNAELSNTSMVEPMDEQIENDTHYYQNPICHQEIPMEALEIIGIMLIGMWLFLPAMVPNSAAVIFGKMSKTKMDFGKSWRGKRIFGDGKSWGGFFGGGLTGIAVGLLLIGIGSLWDPENFGGYGPFWTNVGILACLSFGSLLGDLCGAFIKRRLGYERGQKAPILDQYDFVIGAFLLTSLFFPGWVYANYIEGWHIAALIFIIVMMFAIHRVANIIGYKMGLKKEPW
jgi:CDP-2,3-bis-(O-geranylgeranyl)-sn-glycerol synthase